MVVNSVDEVGVDGLLQVGQGLEVGYFSESDHVVVEELQSGSRPPVEFADLDPDGLSVYGCEIDGGHAILDGTGNSKGILNSDEFLPVEGVFEVEFCYVTGLNCFQLECVESSRFTCQGHSNILVGVGNLSFPSLADVPFQGREGAILIAGSVGRTVEVGSDG